MSKNGDLEDKTFYSKSCVIDAINIILGYLQSSYDHQTIKEMLFTLLKTVKCNVEIKKPVLVSFDSDADEMNKKYGDRYGVDWEYIR